MVAKASSLNCLKSTLKEKDKTMFTPQTAKLPEGFSFLADHAPVSLINEADFGLDRFFGIIGFAERQPKMFSADSAEISLRQEVVKDLLRSEPLRDSFQYASMYTLPLSHDDFVKQYQILERTPFWNKVRRTLATLDKSTIKSRRLKTFRDFLADNLQLEVVERHVANRIAGKVNNMVLSVGYFNLDLNLRGKGVYLSRGGSTNVKSYRRYGPQTVAVLDASLREYRQTRRWKLLPEWLQRKRDKQFIQSVLKAQSSGDASDYLVRKVTAELEKMIIGTYETADTLQQKQMEGDYKLTCAIINDCDGARFRIVDIQPNGLDRSPEDKKLDIVRDDIEQLWPDHIKNDLMFEIQAGNRWLKYQLGMIETSDLTQALLQKDKHMFDWKIFQPEWGENSYCGVSETVSMKDLWESPELIEASTAVARFMQDVNQCLQELSYITKNLTNMMAFAKKCKIKLNMPTLVEDGHIIAFHQMTPVQVYQEPPKGKEPMVLVPVTGMLPLGGSMVVLTGDHGGGKTSICEMLGQQIYLAQAGFPIFGVGMKWSARETIGLSLLEREQGASTMQVFMKKMERLLDSINKSPHSRLLLIMDEVGTGTSPARGEQIGRMIIDNFTNAGIDLLFATQITQVARYAVEQGAISYMVNRQHQIEEGISEPDLDSLLEEFGVTKGFNALSRAA